MTADALDLARRAVACPGWRWMGGARWTGRYAPFEDLCGRYPDSDRGYRIPHDEPLPDLTDPATLGCLLAVVEEARGHPVWLEPADDFGGWLLMGCYAGPQANAAVIADGPTEAAALVAALEAAP